MVRERRLPLLEALEACGFDVLPVCDCSEARRILETEPKVQVVLTDSVLPDGDWRRGTRNRCPQLPKHRSSRLLVLGRLQAMDRRPGAGCL